MLGGDLEPARALEDLAEASTVQVQVADDQLRPALGEGLGAADASDVLRIYRDFVAEAPDELGTVQGALNDTVRHGWHYYWKAMNLAGLSDDTIATIAEHVCAARSSRSYAAIFHFGGAVARVAPGATAYAGRDVAHNIIIDAVWLPEESGEHAAAERAWARRFLQALRPHRAAGVYVNFLDADDVFHHNKNILPA